LPNQGCERLEQARKGCDWGFKPGEGIRRVRNGGRNGNQGRKVTNSRVRNRVLPTEPKFGSRPQKKGEPDPRGTDHEKAARRGLHVVLGEIGIRRPSERNRAPDKKPLARAGASILGNFRSSEPTERPSVNATVGGGPTWRTHRISREMGVAPKRGLQSPQSWRDDSQKKKKKKKSGGGIGTFFRIPPRFVVTGGGALSSDRTLKPGPPCLRGSSKKSLVEGSVGIAQFVCISSTCN